MGRSLADWHIRAFVAFNILHGQSSENFTNTGISPASWNDRKLWGSSSLYMLTSTLKFEATDPRDRIYVFLGLNSTDKNHQELIPDYSKSTAQVFTEAFRHIV